MKVEVNQHETSEIGSSLHKQKGTLVKKRKEPNQRQSKQNIIPNINKHPSAAVFTDLVNQHFSLLV